MAFRLSVRNISHIIYSFQIIDTGLKYGHEIPLFIPGNECILKQIEIIWTVGQALEFKNLGIISLGRSPSGAELNKVFSKSLF